MQDEEGGVPDCTVPENRVQHLPPGLGLSTPHAETTETTEAEASHWSGETSQGTRLVLRRQPLLYEAFAPPPTSRTPRPTCPPAVPSYGR